MQAHHGVAGDGLGHVHGQRDPGYRGSGRKDGGGVEGVESPAYVAGSGPPGENLLAGAVVPLGTRGLIQGVVSLGAQHFGYYGLSNIPATGVDRGIAVLTQVDGEGAVDQ